MIYSCIVEDSYGKSFWQKFIRKKSKIINLPCPREISSCKYTEPKFHRYIRNYIQSKDCFVLILLDGDGHSLPEFQNCILNSIKSEYRNKIKLFLFDYEIEEWICHDLNIKYKNSKPSQILKHKQKYEKHNLPNYAEKLDCNKLKTCVSFDRFLSTLKN